MLGLQSTWESRNLFYTLISRPLSYAQELGGLDHTEEF